MRKEPLGELLVITVGSNCVSQSFFKTMEIVEEKPWIRKDGTFFLYDYVHIFKCIQNNWSTEKCGQRKYVDGVIKIA